MNAAAGRRIVTGRRIVAAGVTVLLLAIGGAAILLSPRDADVTAPIEVVGAAGHLVSARELAVRVDGVRLARRVVYPTESDPPSSTTAGVWVVVDATVSGGRQETTAQWSQLRLAGSTFSLAADAGFSSLNARTFAVGVPFRGSFVFEVSASALTAAMRSGGRAELVLRDTPNGIPDSQPVVRLRLSGLRIASSAAVRDPGVAER